MELDYVSGIRNIDFGRTPAVRPSSNNPIFYAPRISDYEYLLDYQHSRMMPGVVLDFQSSRMVPAVHSGSLDTDLAELPRSVVPQPPITSEVRLPLTMLDFVIPPAFMPGQLQQEQSHHDITTASSVSSEPQLLLEIDNEVIPIAADCSFEDLELQVRGSRRSCSSHFSDAIFKDAGGDLMRHEPAGDLEDGWEELPMDEGWSDFSELVSDEQGVSAVFVEIREADQPGSSENEGDLTPYAAAELLDAVPATMLTTLTFMGDIATPLFCATGIEKAISGAIRIKQKIIEVDTMTISMEAQFYFPHVGLHMERLKDYHGQMKHSCLETQEHNLKKKKIMDCKPVFVRTQYLHFLLRLRETSERQEHCSINQTQGKCCRTPCSRQLRHTYLRNGLV
ncbi:hypothetical protein SELMODRAFT_406148 [Selaginella moellendorffii]|uniref:Uncharacterized protein n=1 Tax=Selaginella moellendorffii TaxID=88036 RepID=D8R1F2_SELML|nr:hypothetical protein SELMODRAFT_406148 [Selaginella moellendorffii]